MPPLKGIDRGLNGDALKALEEAGHGQRIAIVDPSYAIPEGARVIPYQGESSATALKGILSLIPIEKIHGSDALIMEADERPDDCEATKAFDQVAVELGLVLGSIQRHDTSDLFTGFYTEVNQPDTLFFRTRDEKAYACATFIVGHSQVIDAPAEISPEIEEHGLGYATFDEFYEFAVGNPQYSEGQVPTRLWSQLMKYANVFGRYNSKECHIQLPNGPELELFRIAQQPDPTRQPSSSRISELAHGYEMNLESLNLLVASKEFLWLPNLGKKSRDFARDFLASRSLEDESST